MRVITYKLLGMMVAWLAVLSACQPTLPSPTVPPTWGPQGIINPTTIQAYIDEVHLGQTTRIELTSPVTHEQVVITSMPTIQAIVELLRSSPDNCTGTPESIRNEFMFIMDVPGDVDEQVISVDYHPAENEILMDTIATPNYPYQIQGTYSVCPDFGKSLFKLLDIEASTTFPSLQPSSSPQTNLQTPITSVHMVNDLKGWAMSQTLVMYTKDGGKTWQDITPKDIGVFFSSLSSQARSTFEITGAFFNAHDAWVAVPQAGKITLFRTEDGGLNWQTIALSTIQSRGSFPIQIISLVFVNPQIGWLLLSMGSSAGQENVELYQTKDSGITWNLIADAGQNAAKGKITSDGTKTGLGFRDPSEGWLTGSTHGNTVFLYHTRDGGATWDTQSLDLPAGFTATGGSATSYPPHFFDEQRGVIPVYLGSTNPGINLFFYLTMDGGVHWVATSPVISPTNRFFWSWVDAQHGFAAEVGTDILLTTTNSGQSWTKINSGAVQFGELDFISASIGWAISGGMLYQTQDGGQQWIRIAPTMSMK